MFRTDSATSTGSFPTPAAVGPNPNSYFTGGNPGSGTPATIVTADWANAVQEELCYVIEQAGLTLDKTTRTQLKTAIDTLRQKNGAAYAASTTAANTYTATLSPVPTAYTTGMVVFIRFTNANTAACTINLNSLGAKSIKKLDGTDPASGDIANGMVAVLVYDGTNFQLVNANLANYITKSQLQLPTVISAFDASGAANTVTVTLNPAPSSYVYPLFLMVKIANTNTGTSTLNVNSLGATSIKQVDGGNIKAGALQAGMIAMFQYDGSVFVLLNPRTTRDISSAAAGYMYTENGGLIQWGSNASSVAGSTISFPIAFPNACRQVVASDSGNQHQDFGVDTITTTNFVLYSGGTFTARWVAVGN